MPLADTRWNPWGRLVLLLSCNLHCCSFATFPGHFGQSDFPKFTIYFSVFRIICFLGGWSHLSIPRVYLDTLGSLVAGGELQYTCIVIGTLLILEISFLIWLGAVDMYAYLGLLDVFVVWHV